MKFIMSLKKVSNTIRQHEVAEYLYEVDYKGDYDRQLVMKIIYYIEDKTVRLRPNELLIPIMIIYNVPDDITYMYKLVKIYNIQIDTTKIQIIKWAL